MKPYFIHVSSELNWAVQKHVCKAEFFEETKFSDIHPHIF